MRYRRMGASGLKLSVFSIGSWTTYGRSVGDDTARRCLLTAFEAGVNFFDNAEAYGAGQAEEVVGRVLSELRREELVISSKVFWGGEGPNDRGLSRKHVTEACHAALRRLRTDYLDLYFCHRPDPDTPIVETVRAMSTLIQQGKVLYWGTSEWSAAQVEEAFRVAERHHLEPPSVEQPQYNVLHRERVEGEYRALCERQGLGLTTWSPLASGVLTGKYDAGIPRDSRLGRDDLSWLREALLTEERVAQVRELSTISEELGCTRAQLALAWCAAHPHVSSVITGASRPEQVTENLKALVVLEQLDEVLVNRIAAVFS